MAYTNVVFDSRYQWDDVDKDWNWISPSASMNVELLFPGQINITVVESSGLSSTVREISSGYHRSGGHQLWIVLQGIGAFSYVCYTGKNGTGVLEDDANALKYWLTQNLTIDPLSAWPEGWDVDPDAVIEPPVVVPDPVSPSVEEADFGHLRTQFRRQSILRRRNA